MPEEIHALIEMREWDMRTAEAREHFKTANVRKLPSIAVGGKLVYEAIIPDQDELIEKIMRCFRRG
ncbi:MAG: hypothetical protein HGJ93_19295 [Desulfosarcina sp.]|nr:hypothetical protein [Desulfosarcina sp.]MBC2768012.1 hypothetical protein [Desulfosarcina sp.]